MIPARVTRKGEDGNTYVALFGPIINQDVVILNVVRYLKDGKMEYASIEGGVLAWTESHPFAVMPGTLTMPGLVADAVVGAVIEAHTGRPLNGG
jgi:hypothetical protein